MKEWQLKQKNKNKIVKDISVFFFKILNNDFLVEKTEKFKTIYNLYNKIKSS